MLKLYSEGTQKLLTYLLDSLVGEYISVLSCELVQWTLFIKIAFVPFYHLYVKGYSIKTYHPGGDPTLKLAKPPLEVQLSVYRPTLEPCSFNTYPPLEEIFISFRMVLVVCIMYVCMYVCTHLFKLTPNMCLLKMSLLKYFYRIFFFLFFFLLFFWAGGGGAWGEHHEWFATPI